MRKRDRRSSADKRKIVKANGENWDWSYLLDLEKAKLEMMLRDFQNHSDLASVDENVRDMKLALNLIKIINGEYETEVVCGTPKFITDHESGGVTFYKLDPDSFKLEDFAIVNDRNASRFSKHELTPTDLRTEKAWCLYHKLKSYKMRTWWY